MYHILVSSATAFYFILFYFLKIYFIDFLQRGRERERESETSMREKHRSAASCTSPTGDMPATQVHAPDRNRTWDPSVHRLTLHPPSQTGFGICYSILDKIADLMSFHPFISTYSSKKLDTSCITVTPFLHLTKSTGPGYLIPSPINFGCLKDIKIHTTQNTNKIYT
uniref:Uncharacterized protein n=1 Tax=Myotis myotis TaxID=51298 RepID=A0A7J7Y019_MYOMY|nr:hypothetical protein mMyoMyo1_011462 [Myotis myotis]